MAAKCPVCFAHCQIQEGGTGRCNARINQDGKIISAAYGQLTSLALDPIEKKPLNRFYPGSNILSVGSYGCNLRCPFCQNHSISMGRPASGLRTEYWEPERLTDLAQQLKSRDNIGIAFTYNEPMINYEYVYDTSVLMREKGLKTVLVTNGTAEENILKPMLPYIDAMNIDIKGFTREYYRDFLKGDLQQVMRFIELASESCHVELTILIIPGMNDSDAEMRRLCSWITSLKNGTEIPLHISRFFPNYKLLDTKATPVETIYHLKDVAEEYLKYVYTGNC